MGKLKALVVDDEQVVRDHFARQIPWEETGLTWMGSATNGREAISRMEQELPDVVFTDITMPVMDGLEFAAYVRERWPEVKLIFLTAHDEFAYARQAVVLGAKNYLLKIGLTKDQIVQACRQAAEELIRERQASPPYNGKRESGNDSTMRSHLLRILLADQGRGDGRDFTGLLSDLVDLEGAYFSVISLAWDVYSLYRTRPLDREEMNKRQSSLSLVLESLAANHGIRAVALPYKNTRLTLVVSSPVKQSYTDFQVRLHDFLGQLQAAAEPVVESSCHLHVSDIAPQQARLPEMIRDGQVRLLDYFYTGKPIMTAGMVKPDYEEPGSSSTLELAAEITVSLREGDSERFTELLARLTAARDQAYSPQFLLNIAQWVADHGTESSATEGEHLRFSLELVCSWSQYCDWWERMKVHLLLPEPVSGSKGVRKEIKMIRQWVGQHYHTHLQMTDVAEAVHLNPAYLGQLFKQETGEYLSDYISRVRIHKAKELLEGTNMKIYEVAQAVGLTDYRYFCKMFKKWIGYTPTEYKKSV